MNKKEVLDALAEEFAKSLKGIDAANGEVIMTMFPNFEVKIIGDTVIMETHYPHPFCKMQFDIRYWNAPYNKASN